MIMMLMQKNQRQSEAVPEEYDNKCAICRCSEPKILQAAHIIAVSDGGNDDPKKLVYLLL